MDMEKKNLQKNLDYNPGKNYSNTALPGECVYTGMQVLGFEGSFEMSNEPISVNYIYKDKTLEVLERDFALKYTGPYKTFIEEQNKRLLDFIKTYSENHEEKK